MSPRERIGVWVWLGLLTVVLGVGLALLYGEIAAVRLQLEIATGARPATAAGAGWSAPAA